MNYQEMYERAQKEKKLVDVTPEFVKFQKVDDFRVGRFVETVQIESQQTGGKYLQYIFDTDTGRIKFHMGANADREIGATMKRGCVYFVQFKGQEEIGHGQSVNKWSVLLLEDTLADEVKEEKEPF